MSVKYTEEQLKAVKGLIEAAEAMSMQLLHIIKNHGLDSVEGCEIAISVVPENLFTTEFIQFGNVNKDSGIIRLGKGRRSRNEKWVPFGSNSAEYELLFADEDLKRKLQESKTREKPLPPDGLWIGDDRNNPPVDGWEWDVNDSLS